MGKNTAKAIKPKVESSVKIQARKNSIMRRLEKRARDLNKRYPGNKYEIKGNNVVMISGIKPHKKSKKAK